MKDIMQTAQTIRASHPWIPLCDAIVYADPASAFHNRSGFFGFGVSKETIAFAWAHYASLWGPVNRRISADLGPCTTLETEDDSEVKQAYGAIVKREQRLYIGYERLSRKAKGRLGRMSWPGSSNMRKGACSYLESEGLLTAVLACVQ